MPKVTGIDYINDDEEDIADKIHQASLTTTIYKEDVRLIITESAKATPSKMSGPGGAGGIKKPSPQTTAKRPLGGAGGGFGKPKMGGGFGGPRKPVMGGGIKPKGVGVGAGAAIGAASPK